MIGFVQLAFSAFSGASTLTKIIALGSILLALSGVYGIWHHRVYKSGYDAAILDIAKADAKAVKRARDARARLKACDGTWDQTAGVCRQ